jgi:hypothetical protein
MLPEQILSLKSQLKAQAVVIRETRKEMKNFQRENRGCQGGLLRKLEVLRADYRHRHIAYCLMRGTPYERIEKPREGNEPDMALIREIQNEYTAHVCAGA